MRCAEVRELLPAYERDADPTLVVRRHLASCADCREEVARYRELAGGLHQLRSETSHVPPALSRALMAIPSDQSVVANVRTHVSRNRAAYVGGAVAVAGALGATLWRARSRRVVTA
jgi:predicted anti-sigma-YlaC factor YlaD